MIHDAINNFQRQLRKQGLTSYARFSKKMHDADVHGSKTLSLQQFSRVLRESSIELPEKARTVYY